MIDNFVLSCKGIARHFNEASGVLKVLTNVNLQISLGEKIAIIGSSGSGKTTLLHILGGLDQPTYGEIFLNGELFSNIDEIAKCASRNNYIGFIYQFHHLLGEFSAQENVAFPLMIRGLNKKVALRKSKEMLGRVRLGDRLSHKPAALSGGERQRAAVARALITKPKIILADEPTGNLDSNNREEVLELLLELNDEINTSLIIVTHDKAIAKKMDRILHLEDGIIHQL
tara:strand:- start:2787 stop:3470 length:684 start_codon:yes stop_codon:yes gene_type:complete